MIPSVEVWTDLESLDQTDVLQAHSDVLRDSAPDRWGRRIVLRELAEQAASQGISPRSLDDADFFLGVSDQVRQGALRFKKPNGAAFLSPANSVPPLIQLPQLLRASHNVMNESAHE